MLAFRKRRVETGTNRQEGISKVPRLVVVLPCLRCPWAWHCETHSGRPATPHLLPSARGGAGKPCFIKGAGLLFN